MSGKISRGTQPLVRYVVAEVVLLIALLIVYRDSATAVDQDSALALSVVGSLYRHCCRRKQAGPVLGNSNVSLRSTPTVADGLYLHRRRMVTRCTFNGMFRATPQMAEVEHFTSAGSSTWPTPVDMRRRRGRSVVEGAA